MFNGLYSWFEDFISAGPFVWFAAFVALVGLIFGIVIVWQLYKSGEAVRDARKKEAKLAKQGKEAIEKGEKLDDNDPRLIAFKQSNPPEEKSLRSTTEKEADTPVFNPSKKDTFRPVKDLGGPTLEDYYKENGITRKETPPAQPVASSSDSILGLPSLSVAPKPTVAPLPVVKQGGAPLPPPVITPQVPANLQNLLDDETDDDPMNKLRKNGM